MNGRPGLLILTVAVLLIAGLAVAMIERWQKRRPILGNWFRHRERPMPPRAAQFGDAAIPHASDDIR